MKDSYNCIGLKKKLVRFLLQENPSYKKTCSVPISIPATINKFNYLTGVHQPQQQRQQPVIQQHQPPPLQPAPSKAVASSTSTTLALKQVKTFFYSGSGSQSPMSKSSLFNPRHAHKSPLCINSSRKHFHCCRLS